MARETPSVTEARLRWEAEFDAATPNRQQEMIEEWQRDQKRLMRLSVKDAAREIVDEMFAFPQDAA